MPSPLSYEPSVQAVMRDLLPPDARLLAGERQLRNRVSWTVIARSTGIGEIEGGELVLVPGPRSREVMDRLRDLAASGITAVVFTGAPPDQERVGVELPVIAISRAMDVRQLQAEIERYISRRRRELFALDQELHRTLVDGAIGGTSLGELAALAARRAGSQVLVDRDGEVVLGRPEEPPPEDMLVRARAAAQRADAVPVFLPGAPAGLLAPIVTGRERHGFSLVIAPAAEITDDDEVILVSLASAAAILLGREPDDSFEPLGAVLQSLDENRGGDTRQWLALAVSDGAPGLRRLWRSIRAELSARGSEGCLAVADESVVVLLPGADQAQAASVIRALRARTGSSTLRAGVGRPQAGPAGAKRSADQALAARGFAEPGEMAEYGAIEIDVLLGRDPAWLEFARAQLGPLLGPRPDERELFQSLRAYLVCGRNAKAAARELQVHRNTLQYRLRRIEMLLDRSLDDADALFALDLACRVVEIQERRR